MIKNAKSGDVIFELDYDERYKTCKITEHVVKRDQERSDYIRVSIKDKLVHPYQAFKTYKQAHRAYISYLKSDLKRANEVIALVTKILEGLKK